MFVYIVEQIFTGGKPLFGNTRFPDQTLFRQVGVSFLADADRLGN